VWPAYSKGNLPLVGNHPTGGTIMLMISNTYPKALVYDVANICALCPALVDLWSWAQRSRHIRVAAVESADEAAPGHLHATLEGTASRRHTANAFDRQTLKLPALSDNTWQATSQVSMLAMQRYRSDCGSMLKI
jgi:hypothetical protein